MRCLLCPVQVVYNSATALLAGLRLAGERLDLAWVDNRFARPTVLGYRDVAESARAHSYCSVRRCR